MVKKILLLSPVVRSRKGHYRELFAQYSKKGYLQARVDGEIIDIEPDLKLDRYKTHDIEIVVDRLIIGEAASEARIQKSLSTALHLGEGIVMIQKFGEDNFRYFSKNLMDAVTGESIPLPEPNTFFF